jgi:hypothetical protein
LNVVARPELGVHTVKYVSMQPLPPTESWDHRIIENRVRVFYNFWKLFQNPPCCWLAFNVYS